jgi:uncharacterized delta-60 repeat protein
MCGWDGQKARLTLLAGTLALAMAAPAAATPGDPDVDFGGTGSVTIKDSTSGSKLISLADVRVDGANRAVVVGGTFPDPLSSGEVPHMFVERLRPDGGTDRVSEIFSQAAAGESLAVLGDDDVAVGGLRFASDENAGEFEIFRLPPNYVPDQNGSLAVGETPTSGRPPTGIQDLLVQADGEPVEAGTAFVSNEPAIALARVLSNSYGAPDPSFSFDGVLVEEVPGATQSFETGLACSLPGRPVDVCAPGSKILVSAEAQIGGVASIAVARFNSDGTLDRTFAKGSGDAVLGPMRSSAGDGTLAATTPGHRLIVDFHGRPIVGMGRDVERLNPDGTPDTTFGNSGVVGLEAGANVVSLAATPQNGVLVLLTTPGGAELRRFTSTGAPDTAFGRGGTAKLSATANPTALALTDDAKIYVVGTDSSSLPSVSRLLDVAITPPVVIVTPRSAAFAFTLSAPEAVGILVQRRAHGRWVKVGRVPFGLKRRGRHRIRWKLRVNGRRLPPGLYRVRVRLLDRHGRVFEVSKPFRVRVR